MLSRFHLIPERNRRAERQTDRQTNLQYQYRASCADARYKGSIFQTNRAMKLMF